MKKVLSLVILSIFTLLPLNAATFQGGVAEQGSGNASRIIDKQTGEGVGGADIRLPKQNYSTRTDSSGLIHKLTARASCRFKKKTTSLLQ